MNIIKQVEKILEMTVNEKLNAIYEKHKENFPNSFFSQSVVEIND